MDVEKQAHIPINIRLKNEVEIDGEKDNYELVLSGQFYEKNNSFFLIYDEVQEEGNIHTIVKFSKESALILRSGAINMRLAFHLTERQNGSYQSPQGTLLLTTETRELSHRCTYNEESLHGEIKLQYELLMQESPVGQYSMIISFQGNVTE